ncbi:AAA family ATPase [Ruegeria sp. HKCCD8929]|uniref:ATP-binding protein n=1 Tax=Ruegeria sp. HKCCD8929 TaxID=2683006 RepID=UPI0014877F63|nr:AAA family ATPase [Ruegeria sp. HKCCD8929]
MRYYFDRYRLDAERRELHFGSQRVQLAPKTFSILLHLVSNSHRMVSKAELLDAFWASSVSESVLQTTIRLARQAIGDNGRDQRLIRTYHGQGFRFAVDVMTEEAALDGVEEQSTATAPAPMEPATGDFEERRLAAVLACRFKSSEQFETDAESGEDPEMEFLQQARQVIEAHDGVLLHTMPDGFTAVFGAARGVENGRHRAALCAEALKQEADALDLASAGTTLGFGIDWGRFPIVTGQDEAPFRALPSAVLKTALFLAGEAEAGQVIFSAKIEKDRTKATGFRAFLGRQAELTLLQGSYERVTRGQGQAVVLSGQAGIGKSRLLKECLNRLEHPGLRVLRLDCMPLTRSTPLAVFSQLCQEICGEGGCKLTLTDPLDQALLTDLLDPNQTDRAQLSELSPHMRRQRTFAIIQDLIASQADRGVLVISVEDIHWMDATSRECLTYILQHLEKMPVFILLTTRPVQEIGFAEWLPLTVLQLAPLDQQDCVDLVKSKPELGGLSEADILRLASRAAGNPFFLEELSMAVEVGSAPDGGLPDTVQAVITARFDSLDTDARSLLQAAAVVGPVTPISLVSQLLGWTDIRFEAAQAELLGAGVLVEDTLLSQQALRFRHILLQEAAYEMLAKNERVSLHRKIAHIIRQTETDLHPERLAWHFQEAGETALAVDHWTRAARMAHQRSASRETIDFAQSGLRLLEAEADDIESVRKQMELQLTLAPALAAASGYGSEDVGAAYRKARDLSRKASTPRSEFRMLVGLWNYNWVRGNLSQAHRQASELLDLAKAEDDPTLQLRALACMGEILFHAGDLTEAQTNLQRACSIYDQLKQVNVASQVPAVACHSYAAWTASLMGQSKQARQFSKKAGVIAHELVQPFSLSLFYSLSAMVCVSEGDIEECLTMARAGREISERGGFPFWLGTSLVAEGWAEAHLGETDNGLARLLQGIEVFEDTGARIQLANWYGLLAEALLCKGDAQAAQDALDTATSWAEATGDVFFKPRLDRAARKLANLA